MSIAAKGRNDAPEVESAWNPALGLIDPSPDGELSLKLKSAPQRQELGR